MVRQSTCLEAVLKQRAVNSANWYWEAHKQGSLEYFLMVKMRGGEGEEKEEIRRLIHLIYLSLYLKYHSVPASTRRALQST